MTEQELENKIRKSLKVEAIPSREDFACLLSKLPEYTVIKDREEKFNISGLFYIWKSKRMILFPSFLLLFFVGMYAFVPRTITNNGSNYNPILEQLAEQNETIEEPGVDNDDQIILTNFDAPAVNDLSTTKNEF